MTLQELQSMLSQRGIRVDRTKEDKILRRINEREKEINAALESGKFSGKANLQDISENGSEVSWTLHFMITDRHHID